MGHADEVAGDNDPVRGECQRDRSAGDQGDQLFSRALPGSARHWIKHGDVGLEPVTFTEPSAAAWAASAPLANTMAATDPSTISRLKGLLTLFFLLAIPRDLRYPAFMQPAV